MVYLYDNDVPSTSIILEVLGVVTVLCLVYCCMYSEVVVGTGCVSIGLRSARDNFANNSSVNARVYVRSADRLTWPYEYTIALFLIVNLSFLHSLASQAGSVSKSPSSEYSLMPDRPDS